MGSPGVKTDEPPLVPQPEKARAPVASAHQSQRMKLPRPQYCMMGRQAATAGVKLCSIGTPVARTGSAGRGAADEAIDIALEGLELAHSAVAERGIPLDQLRRVAQAGAVEPVREAFERLGAIAGDSSSS
jgi:hypothetical protein